MNESLPITDSGSGWTRTRIVFLGIWLLIAVGVVIWAREVILPFILALVIAYVLTPLVARCEKWKIPRAVAIVLVYVVTLGGAYFAIAAMAPRLYLESMKLARDVPEMTGRFATIWAPKAERFAQVILDRMSPPAAVTEEQPAPALQVAPRGDGSFSVEIGSGFEIVQQDDKRWRVESAGSDAPEKFNGAQMVRHAVAEAVGYAKRNAIELLKFGQAIFGKLVGAIFLFFMTLMIAAYLMLTREKIVDFFRSLPPQRSRPSFDRLLYRIDRGLSGVVRGQLLICLVNGALSAIGFALFGLKYWPILAIVAGVMSLIPIFGSILSSVPIVMIALTQNFWMAIWVLLWIIGIHQIEANLLNPKIIGVAAKIHPVLVVFSLLVGEHYFGIWGALFAVPVLSIVQNIFQHYRYELLPDAGPDSLRSSALRR